MYEASKGTFTKCRELKAKSRGAKAPEDPAAEAMLPKAPAANGVPVGAGAPPAPGGLGGPGGPGGPGGFGNQDVADGRPRHALAESIADSWYKEVLDLRKRAGEYKVRLRIFGCGCSDAFRLYYRVLRSDGIRS